MRKVLIAVALLVSAASGLYGAGKLNRYWTCEKDSSTGLIFCVLHIPE